MQSKDNGFTIIEVIAAIAVLAIVIALVAPAFLENLSSNNKTEDLQYATGFASGVLEDYRKNSNVAVLPQSGTQTVATTYKGKTYNAVTTFCPSDVPSIMPCYAGTARFIKVEVQSAGKTIYTVSTYYVNNK